MAGYRISHPAIQWTADDFTLLIPDGKLVFSDSGTATPRAVYSDEAATVSIGSELTLDAAGRTADFFMDGEEYRVRLLDADDNQVWLRDHVRGVISGGVSLPDPSGGADGDVVVVSGAGFALETLLRLPDPTGSDTYMVIADGDGYSLTPQATPESFEIPTGGVTQASATAVTIGAVMLQAGSGTCPTSGSETSSVAVTFSTAFGAGTVYVVCSGTTSGAVTADGARAFVNGTAASTTGFTAVAAAQDEHDGADTNLNGTVGFSWIAWGPAP